MAAKKPKRERERKAPRLKVPRAKPPETRPADEDDERTDYGGLPYRDLKKNLGCG